MPGNEKKLAEPSSVSAFFGPVDSRAGNGGQSEHRERVVEMLLASHLEALREAMKADEEFGEAWARLHEGLLEELARFADHDEELDGARAVDATRAGGRGNRYDFDGVFRDADRLLSVKLELKKASDFYAYPEFLQVPARSGNVEIPELESYPGFFYDEYVDVMAASVGVEPPDRDWYTAKVLQSKHTIHPMFEALHDAQKSSEDAIAEGKAIADKSIDRYLVEIVGESSEHLNWPRLNADFLEQTEKVFICWDSRSERFNAQRLRREEMMPTGSVRFERGNQSNVHTLALETEAGSKITMLLRWKNRPGVLYPAWQIKAHRPPAVSTTA